MRQDAKFLRRFKRKDRKFRFEGIPTFGVCRVMRYELGCAIYLHIDHHYIAAIRGWFDGELITIYRSVTTGKFIARIGASTSYFNYVMIIQNRRKWIEFFREWNKDQLDMFFSKFAIMVTDGNREWHIIPFWRAMSKEIEVLPVVTEAIRNVEDRRVELPFKVRATGRRVHVDEIIEDNYGVQWKILGYHIHENNTIMITARHMDNQITLSVLSTAFGRTLVYDLPAEPLIKRHYSYRRPWAPNRRSKA